MNCCERERLIPLQTMMITSRRTTERIPLYSSWFDANWLSEWINVDSAGVLTNISAEGFAGRMRRAPTVGHVIHARLTLREGERKDPPLSIDVDAVVCQRHYQGDADSEAEDEWTVHCAIESIHPAEKMQLMQAIATLKPEMP